MALPDDDRSARWSGGCQRTVRIAVAATWLLALSSVVILAVTASTFAEQTTSDAPPTTGHLQGHVVYQADAARPWRFGRYYINDSRTGYLSEAVVTLRGRSLPASSARIPRVHGVDQFNFQFVPETLAITAGDSVRFTNSDSTTHNVRSDSTTAGFNVSIEIGGEYTHRFPRAGDIRNPATVGCIYHGGMRAWIFVFDHDWYDLTEADGRFELSDIPPGEYTLEMVHPAGRLTWRKRIIIHPGESTKLDIQVSPDDIPPP